MNTSSKRRKFLPIDVAEWEKRACKFGQHDSSFLEKRARFHSPKWINGSLCVKSFPSRNTWGNHVPRSETRRVSLVTLGNPTFFCKFRYKKVVKWRANDVILPFVSLLNFRLLCLWTLWFTLFFSAFSSLRFYHIFFRNCIITMVVMGLLSSMLCVHYVWLPNQPEYISQWCVFFSKHDFASGKNDIENEFPGFISIGVM